MRGAEYLELQNRTTIVHVNKIYIAYVGLSWPSLKLVCRDNFYYHHRTTIPRDVQEFVGLARTVYHFFKYRIYRMYIGINRIKPYSIYTEKPYSVYTEKSVSFRFKS